MTDIENLATRTDLPKHLSDDLRLVPAASDFSDKVTTIVSQFGGVTTVFVSLPGSSEMVGGRVSRLLDSEWAALANAKTMARCTGSRSGSFIDSRLRTKARWSR